MVPARPVRSIAPIECHPSTHGRHKRAKRRGGLPFPPLRVKLQKQIIIPRTNFRRRLRPGGCVHPVAHARGVRLRLLGKALVRRNGAVVCRRRLHPRPHELAVRVKQLGCQARDRKDAMACASGTAGRGRHLCSTQGGCSLRGCKCSQRSCRGGGTAGERVGAVELSRHRRLAPWANDVDGSAGGASERNGPG